MRSSDIWRVPVAEVPDPLPLWPLPTVTPKFWDESLGYQRPFSCEDDDCVRWHAGIDLTDAKRGSIVVATERCRVRRLGGVWKNGTTYVCAQNEASVAIYGGIEPGSWEGIEEGSILEAGARLGRIGSGYGDMLHFELYEASDERTTHSRWWRDKPPPEGLLNPVNYLQAAAGMPRTLATTPQRHEALEQLGFFSGPTFAPWSDNSKAALLAAQAALGLKPDGIWGPKTDETIRARLARVTPTPSRHNLAVAGGVVAAIAVVTLTVALVSRRVRPGVLTAAVAR